ncbi:MAG: hypothetical protein K0B07_04020 [DPANN group archaeon]|nr:hypothetical protein [DPANN group archaeon]
MVFVWLVNKIAGIFKKYGSDISKSDVDEDFDMVLQVIQEGFGKIRSRFETVDNEINNIRAAVLLKDVHSSEHESLRQDILSNTSQYNYILNNVHNLYNRIDAVEQSVGAVNKSSDSEELHQMYNNLDSRIQSSNLKIQEEVMAKIIPHINAIETKISDVNSKNYQLVDEIRVLKEQIKMSVRSSDNNVITKDNNIVSPINNVTTTNESLDVVSHSVTTAFKPSRTIITSRNLNKVLPSALIPTFNELLNADKFLSYFELAKLLDKREATARAYVNDLRNRGVAVEEETRENGRKLVRLAKDIRQQYIIPE